MTSCTRPHRPATDLRRRAPSPGRSCPRHTAEAGRRRCHLLLPVVRDDTGTGWCTHQGLRMRHVEQPFQLTPQPLLKKVQQGNEVLETTNMAALVGVMAQLGFLATYAHEIFNGLAEEANEGVRRIGALKTRLGAVSERLGRVDDALGALGGHEIADICGSDVGIEFNAEPDEACTHARPDACASSVHAVREGYAINRDERSSLNRLLGRTINIRAEGRVALAWLPGTCSALLRPSQWTTPDASRLPLP
eukprot:5576058-Pleurochrysis_carterae.AAC.1